MCSITIHYLEYVDAFQADVIELSDDGEEAVVYSTGTHGDPDDAANEARRWIADHERSR